MYRFCFIIFSVFTFVSCEKEEDDLADFRERFVGEWTVTEGIGSDVVSFDVEIQKDEENKNNILVYNFHDIGDDFFVEFKVSTVNANALSFSGQQVGTYYFDNGVGNLQSDNSIDFTFVVNDGNGNVNISSRFNR